ANHETGSHPLFAGGGRVERNPLSRTRSANTGLGHLQVALLDRAGEPDPVIERQPRECARAFLQASDRLVELAPPTGARSLDGDRGARSSRRAHRFHWASNSLFRSAGAWPVRRHSASVPLPSSRMCRSRPSSFLDPDVVQVFARTGRTDGKVQAATLATKPAAVEAAARHGLAAARWAQDVGVFCH